MKFAKLRLLGFKSFVDATEFLIEPGLTGVVGPNGCGKSNLVEALRWVMGENSYKSMRASGMDDVIFSGSLHRPSRNTAEVSVLLDNTDRTAPLAYNGEETIEITRRIERESGSLYRINSKEVRAKDVALLFADASTGAHSRALVRQGQISELISAKPRDRKQILEEAAGISGLHSRRHEAELRLRASEQNLDRLDDVLTQLDGQLDSLKRQARQAKRYKLVGADIRKAEATLYHLRWLAAGTAVTEAEQLLSTATAALADAQSVQTAAAKDQAMTAHKLPQLRDEEANLAAATQRFKLAEAELIREQERIDKRLNELSQRITQLSDDLTREERMVNENTEVLSRLDAERVDLETAELAADHATSLANADVDTAAAALAAHETELGQLTKQAAEKAAARRQHEQASAQLRERRNQLDQQLEKVAHQLRAATVDAADQAVVDQLRTVIADHTAAALQCEEDTLGKETAAADAKHAAEEARSTENAARTALERLKTEAATLRRIIDAARIGEGASVLETLQVSAGYEVALGAALGDDLDASIGTDASIYWLMTEQRDADPSLPDGVSSLAEFVQADPRLDRRLRQIGVVDAGRGVALQPELKPGQRLVTKEGALWRWDGFVASADAPTAAAQRLARENRLDELDQEVHKATNDYDMQRKARTEQASKSEILSDALRASQQQWRTAQHAIQTARQQLDQHEKKLSERSVQLSALTEAKTQIAAAVETAEHEQNVLDSQFAALQTMPDYMSDIATLNQTLSPLRQSLADAQAHQRGLAQASDGRKQRIAAIDTERQRWIDRMKGVDRQRSVLSERIDEANQERQELEKLPAQISLQQQRLVTQIAESGRNLATAQAARLEAEETAQRCDQAAQDALGNLQRAKEHHIRAEERLMATRERLSDIEIRIEDELEIRPHMVFAAAGLSDDKPLPEEQATETRIERLKSERDRLGAVNLRAEEEATELGEKRDTLIRERDELIEAIKTLRQGIQNLNREGRERLRAAFDVVNGHFQKLFTHLFGGGAAELQLVDSDDPLEAGLEILARPPGKKPQTMTLLSGGEQTLTATALIFAVFLTNPAPICVLDEVDAPLDDANVERYCSLLHEMTRQTDTRFLVITHNPITMAEMDRLFGVTMAERGVSQLVSVDLQTAERYRESA